MIHACSIPDFLVSKLPLVTSAGMIPKAFPVIIARRIARLSWERTKARLLQLFLIQFSSPRSLAGHPLQLSFSWCSFKSIISPQAQKKQSIAHTHIYPVSKFSQHQVPCSQPPTVHHTSASFNSLIRCSASEVFLGHQRFTWADTEGILLQERCVLMPSCWKAEGG